MIQGAKEIVRKPSRVFAALHPHQEDEKMDVSLFVCVVATIHTYLNKQHADVLESTLCVLKSSYDSLSPMRNINRGILRSLDTKHDTDLTKRAEARLLPATSEFK